MNTRKWMLTFSGGLLFIMLLACSFTAGPTPTSTGEESLPGVDGPGPGSSGSSVSRNCANPLWPVSAGSYWTYDSSGSTIGDYTLDYTINAAGPDSFELGSQYSTGVTASQAWQCEAGSLIAMSVGGGAAGSLSATGGVNAQIETTGNSGVSLPSVVNAGQSWSQSMLLSGTVALPDGSSGTAEGSYVADSRAIGTESVTVPAGSFEAMRIEVTSVYSLNITVQGMSVPTVVNNTATFWYAPGIGPVKWVNTNDMMETETTSLTGYFIN